MRATHSNNVTANAQPVEPTGSCPTCEETARRNDQAIDRLQDAVMALTAVDGYDMWIMRSARAKAAMLEAMRLLQVRTWK